MGSAAVAKAFADINAAIAVLTAEVDGARLGASANGDPLHADPLQGDPLHADPLHGDPLLGDPLHADQLNDDPLNDDPLHADPLPVDPLQGLADGCLDVLAGIPGAEARFAGLKARAATKFADTTVALAPPDAPAMPREASVAAEIACVLTIGPRAAAALLSDSHELMTRLPLTLSALQAGTISWQHARVMVDETASLEPAGAAALEAHFLDPHAPHAPTGCPAGEMPASRFRHKARTWRERHHHESIEKRHAKGVLDRRVEYTPDRDGMAWLSTYLPADQAAAAWNRITAIARGLQGPDETRNLPQLRADAYATALLGGGPRRTTDDTGTRLGEDGMGDAGTEAGGGEVRSPGKVPTPRAEVLVTVPVFALLGATDEPAMLDGYGPIPASMARDLVANGADSFYRVLVDPRDGAALEIGRKSYRPSPAMRRWLRMRDGRCPFPGCSNQSLDNEADHLQAWAKGGTTGVSNLGQPCPRHHRLKHTTAWKPTPATKDEPPGWISPSGRRYTSEHQDWEPPHWPEKPGLELETRELVPELTTGGPRPELKSRELGPEKLKSKRLQRGLKSTKLKLRATSNRRPPTARETPCIPDYVHTGLSLGEDGLERFLHAHA